MKTEAMEKVLAEEFNQTPWGVGIAKTGKGLMQLYVTGSGETWTLVLSTPNGMSCVVAAGESWQELAKPAPASWPV